MISEMGEVKRIRAEQRAVQERLIASELEAKGKQRKQASSSVESFSQWLTQEGKRLFESMASMPVSVAQVEDFNAQIDDLHRQKETLLDALEQLRQEEATLEAGLLSALEKRQMAEKSREKFQAVVAHHDTSRRLEAAREEDQSADDVLADLSGSRSGLAQMIGVNRGILGE